MHDGMKGGIQANKPLFFNLKIIIFNIEPCSKIQYFAVVNNLECTNFLNVSASKNLTCSQDYRKGENVWGFQAK